jgi:amino acid adenylation domain-containing protein/non-ribosomal peptide synthase protein (TIGR01720 family)
MKEKIDKSNVQDIFELTEVQKGMLYHYLKSEKDNVYNVQLAFTISGILDAACFTAAVAAVQSGNEALRSVFRWEEVGNPLQVVLRTCPLEVNFHDISVPEQGGLIAGVPDAVATFLEIDRKTRFDLTKLPLRIHIIRGLAGSFVLVITHHHILYDGWSTGILLQEILTTYDRLSRGGRQEKAEKTAYGEMLRAVRQSAHSPGVGDYWKDYLKNYEITSCFAAGNANTVAGDEVRKLRVSMPGSRLEAFAAEQKVTSASVIYAAYGILLRKYFNLQDVVFGTVVSGRQDTVHGAEKVIGNFINTVPVRFGNMEGRSMQDAVSMLHETLIQQRRSGTMSYARIKELLQLKPSEELFDSVLVIENYPLDRSLFDRTGGWRMESVSAYEYTDIPLVVTVFFTGDWEIEFSYRPRDIGNLDIQDLAGRLLTVLEGIVNCPARLIDSFCLLHEEEKHMVLTRFNDTDENYPEEQTVVSLFDRQAASGPELIACRYGDDVLTYGQLKAISRQVALYLSAEGVVAGDIVGVMLEREAFLMPVIFGTMRAGAAYLPMDPDYPAFRIDAIAADSRIRTLITRGRFKHAVMVPGIKIIDLDLVLGIILSLPAKDPEVVLTGRDLAYVIYTSGSTGRPKGVMIEHHSVVNRLLWMQRKFPLGVDDVLLQKTALVFDVSVWELFWWSFTGASLCLLAPGEEKDPARIISAIRDYGVTTLHFVPPMLSAFLEHLETSADPTSLAGLRRVFTSGEALKPEQVNSFGMLIHRPYAVRLINLYGPTEATVDVSWFECSFENPAEQVPIGKPIQNIRFYVLDKWGQPLPAVMPGELYIAGSGLARGYLNNPPLTDEKFVDNPFSKGKKMYRTGDLVKYLPGGDLAFLGRIDHQVKIRGYRIELGEIEYHATLYEGIRECVVLAKAHQSDKFLVAYYVADEMVEAAELKSFLHHRLPDHMVPRYFVRLQNLPLSTNGKLNRNALPDPLLTIHEDFTPPMGEMEKKLAGLWAEILHTEERLISATTSFFEMGGHSLHAITLTGRIFKALQVRVTLKEIFDHPDIRRLCVHLRQERKMVYHPIPMSVSREWHVLSAVQKRLYFLHALERTSTAYNGGLIAVLEGEIDKQRLQTAFRKLIARHEPLRTYFTWQGDAPVQKVLSDAAFEIEFFTADEPYDRWHECIERIAKEFVRPFDLTKAPLLRAGVIELTPARHVLMVDVHHIIGDGISENILIRDFMALYKGDTLAAPVIQYKDYAEWQQGTVQQEIIGHQKDFWMRVYAERPSVLELPADLKRPAVNTFSLGSAGFRISAEDTGQLKLIADGEGATLFMVILAIYNIFLSRLGNNEDIVVGCPVAGREHPDLENVMGMFVNTLPLRNYPRGARRFREFLSSCKQHSLACLANQDYPYEHLVDALGLERDTSRNPLFDVLLAYRNDKVKALELPELTLTPYGPLHTASHFDLILSVVEEEDQLTCTFQYARELFSKDSMIRYAGYFEAIVKAIIADDDIQLSAIEIITPEERHCLLSTFNNTHAALPPGQTIATLFDQQAECAPDQIALIHGDQHLTYGQLRNKANAIAVEMKERLTMISGDSHVNHKIGLLFNTSLGMSAGILASIRSGFAYVPLSPDVPMERNRYILTEANVSLLLVQKELWEAGGALGMDPDSMVVVDEAFYPAEEIVFPVRSTSPGDLAYIIFTSGTTGKPKGVEVTFGSLLNYALWSISYHQLTPNDRGLQLSPYYFDGFGGIFYRSLLSGGAMITIPQREKLNPRYIARLMAAERVTYSGMLPGLYDGLIDGLTTEQRLPDLRFIILAGEKASQSLIRRSNQFLPGVILENEYGPTEATIGATHCRELNEDNLSVIGKPVWNTSIYILGSNNELLPSGAAGEICIAGAGIARGYVRNGALTAEKFLPDPFMPGSRMYKTGDLGRWLSDGSVEMLGRADDQVKINGFRVELGEIAQRLCSNPLIKESVVVYSAAHGVRRLIAYYTADEELPAWGLKQFLAGELPGYMLPAFYVHLDRIPYTPTGKLDKPALPDPGTGPILEYAAPSTQEEKLLARIWTSVLGVSRIGVDDNFFTIGGDSIRSIQISSKLLGEGYSTTIKDIFTYQTIRQLAPGLKRITEFADPQEATGEYLLTPIQQWFFQGPIKNKAHFNQSVMLHFGEGITAGAVESLFHKLTEHHDALRTVFIQEKGWVLPHIPAAALPVSPEVYHLRDRQADDPAVLSAAQKLQSSILLDKGPLIKLGLFHLKDGSRLLIVIHHLVIDGVSWRILLEDIDRLYMQLVRNEPLSLPPQTHSYRSWSNRMHEYAGTDVFRKAAAYWDRVEDVPALIRDYPDGDNRRELRATVSFQLDEQTTAALVQEAHRPFRTQVSDVLLTSLLPVIREKYGVSSLLIDMEGHGREDIGRGLSLSRTIGWFTTIYPVVLKGGQASLSESIKGVKEALRAIPHHGIDYLAGKYLVGPESGIPPAAQAAVCFNYLGQFDPDSYRHSFSIAREPMGDPVAGDEPALYDWEISAMLVSGRLEMSLHYSSGQYSGEGMAAFMQLYEKSLREVIAYCCMYGKTELTPSDLTYKALGTEQLDRLNRQMNLEDVYPLSPMQECLLFQSQLDPDGERYFEQMVVQINGGLNIGMVQSVMNDLAARHAVLRTLFLPDEDLVPLQVVLQERQVAFSYRDISEECLQSSREAVIHTYREIDRSRRFDLRKDVLIRLSVLRVGEDEFTWIWSHHHIVMDGWCMGIILHEFKELYAAGLRGSTPSLAPVQHYSNYIEWLAGREKQAGLQYWKDYLADYAYPATLPKRAPAIDGKRRYTPASHIILLDRTLTEQLQALSAGHSVTLYTVLQMTWAVLLSRYNDTDDVVFGSVVSGRPSEIPHVADIVGLFINTLPVRIRFTAGEAIAGALQQAQVRSLESEVHHYIPLPDIQSVSDLGRELIDHLLVFENYPISDSILGPVKDRDGNDLFTILNVDTFDQTEYDLVITIVPGDVIRIQLTYNSNAYDEVLVKNVAVQWENIMRQFTAIPAITTTGIDVSGREEKEWLIYGLNATDVPVEDDTVVSLFGQQVRQRPGNTAFMLENRSVTFRQLGEASDRMAAYLIQEHQVRPGCLVGLLLEHDECLLFSILGILKTRAAYVPLDPAYPPERIGEIIRDAGLHALVTRGRIWEGLKAGLTIHLPIIDLDKIRPEEMPDGDRQADPVEPADLAYVIYTSGSTGKPKGTMIAHHSLTNYIKWAADMYTGHQPAVFPLYSSISFDLTVTSIFIPLAFGHPMIIYPQDDKMPVIEKVIADPRPTIIKLTPSHLRIIHEGDGPVVPAAHGLRTLIVGGEELETTLAAAVFQQYAGGIDIYNEYGPTETTVGCMIYKYDPADRTLSVPIGLPVSNTMIYLLDKALRPVPVGAAGELYISGHGLARGYLHNEELTARKFVGNPFVPGTRMYRTGDLACRLSDGRVLFKGRMDNQVKIRGFRVELGEIESRLNDHAGVKEAVVVARGEKGDKTLVAYYVSEKAFEPSELKMALSRSMPDHMVPDFFVRVEKMPLTPNGKLDKKALPSPQLGATTDHRPPVGAIEERLAQLWSKILQTDQQLFGVNRSFFELGGHSLKAMVLAGRIRKEWGITMPLRELFDRPTISSQRQYIEQAFGYQTLPPIGKAETMPYYPVSPAQKRLYFLHEFDRSSLSYNMPYFLRIEGHLQKDRWEDAFTAIIRRHESLRTSFSMSGDQPVQKIAASAAFTIDYYDLENTEASHISNVLQAFVRPFDLEKAPLIRVAFARIHAAEHILMVDMHHIVSDGLSHRIMMEDFKSLYGGQQLQALTLQYKDYAVWLGEKDHAAAIDNLRNFWLNEFAVEAPILDLPTDLARPPVKSNEGASIGFALSAGETEQLQAIAREEGATLFMITFSIFSILLGKLANQEDVVIGTPVSCRTEPELENMIGLFINTLAIRSFPKPEMTFRDFLGEVRTTTIRCFENRQFPYEALINALEVSRNTSRNPLFDVMFIFQEAQAEPELPGFVATSYKHERTRSEFDISLTAALSAEGLLLAFEYATDLFAGDTIGRYIEGFRSIVLAIIADSGQRISDMSILSPGERHRILHEFNHPMGSNADEGTVMTFFESQAERTPDNVALKYGNDQMSYRELDERADNIASFLWNNQRMGPGDLVGVMLRRGEDLVPAVFGILKAGAAYVPIDPDYPQERIRTIIMDAGLKIILTGGDQLQLPVPSGVSVINVGKIRTHVPNAGGEYLPVASLRRRKATGSDLAYVIYTSGSTGRPKGVMIQHCSLLNIVRYMQQRYPLTASGCYLQKTSVCFDVSAAEIFGWFFDGGAMAMLTPGAEGDPGQILDALASWKVTHVNFVPSMFAAFVDEMMMRGVDKASSLQYVFLAGEALPLQLVKRWLLLDLPAAIENIYGPTEGTIYSCGYSIDKAFAGRCIPIGKPLENIRLYVMDGYDQLQPIGVPGELCISGKGVAAGYLNNPALTEHTFTTDPFDPSVRMYRTGDWVRWLPDGNIEFICRIDAQVKIRGFRIEPGEIEHCLSRHQQVTDVKVLAGENSGDPYLMAYYVSDEPIDPDDLRNHLAAVLPSYMLPAYYIHLKSLPLTHNGKVDSKALPGPFLNEGTGLCPPVGITEQRLVEIWSHLLAIDKRLISVTRSFFELGGHSLKATVLVNRIYKEWYVKVPLVQLFRQQDIRSLAAYIREAVREKYSPVHRVADKEHYRLSSAQRRLYFLHELDKASLAYNMPRVLELEGDVDTGQLEYAFNNVLARHESLHSSFRMIDDGPVQVIDDAAQMTMDHFQADESEVEGIIRDYIKPFDLSRGPLIRAALVAISSGRYILIVDTHHIVSDGISQAIFSRDLSVFYRNGSLPAVQVRYRDYAAWQEGEEYLKKMMGQRDFWIHQHLSGPILDLPADRPRPAVKDYAGSTHGWWLDVAQTNKLQAMAVAEGATLFMTLLSIYSIFLGKLGDKEDVVIGIPTAGRHHADLEDIVGMFINTLALRSRPEGTLRFREFLAEVKTGTMACFENQAYPYGNLIEDLRLTRDTSRNPLFDVMFMFQNFDPPAPEIPGVTIRPYPVHHSFAQFDLTLIAGESGGRIFLNFEYATSLFDKSTVERFAGAFGRIVDAVLADADTYISDIGIISPEEKHRLVYSFNDTDVPCSGEDSIISLFEEQVKRTPGNIAVTYGDLSLTYAELSLRSDGIASCLRRLHGVMPGDMVGLMVDRDQYLIPSILGVLKAGAAYLPMDPSYPEERIKYLLEDSAPALVLTDDTAGPIHERFGHSVRMVSASSLYHASKLEDHEDIPPPAPSGLAYMIYTSGSSGDPKGVMIRHSNVVNFVRGIRERIPFPEGGKMLCLTTMSFDIFVLETILPLLSGMEVLLAGTHEQRDPQALYRLIREKMTDCLQITPSHLRLLMDNSIGEDILQDVRILMIGGEAFPASLLRTLQERCKGRIYNMYGPTETTVWSTVQELTTSVNVSIGKPIANTFIRILDKYQKLQAPGVPGELCIGGMGLAKGYWRREELTQKKFIGDPVLHGQLIYRTGDLARWLPDGTVELFGRMDDQVKIRGHRIELGEIEHFLAQHPQVRETVVVAREYRGDKLLTAYYVSAAADALPDLKDHLAGRLPAYMIPSYFVLLSSLPLTPNGKLDRRSLPDPVTAPGDGYTPPSNKTEHKLLEIWSEVLKLDKEMISVEAGFFELGGHSLNAIIIMAKVQKEFGVRLPLVGFFKAPTIRELSRTVLTTLLSRRTDHPVEKVTI